MNSFNYAVRLLACASPKVPGDAQIQIWQRPAPTEVSLEHVASLARPAELPVGQQGMVLIAYFPMTIPDQSPPEGGCARR